MNYQRKRVDEVDDDRLKFEVSTIAFREVMYSFDLNAIDMRNNVNSFDGKYTICMNNRF